MSYADYLMHFRTAGAKNGETKYPGKYKPIGQKAQGIEEAAAKTSLSRMYDQPNQNASQQTPEQLQSLQALRVSGYKGPIPDYLKPNYQEKTADQEIADALKPTQQDLKKKAEEKVDKELKTGRTNKKPGATSRYLDKVEKKKRLKQLIEQKRKELIDQEVMNEMVNQNAENIKHNDSSDYLIHFRTKGSKNGYTKYPGKYNPIGEKAKGISPISDLISGGKEKLRQIGEKVEDKVNQRLTSSFGVNEIKTELRKRANKAINSAETNANSKIDTAIQTYGKRKASDNDSFVDFMKNDIQDRINDSKKSANSMAKSMVKKGGDYLRDTANRAVDDERTSEVIRKILKKNYKNIKNVDDDVLRSVLDPKVRKKYTNIALDAALPTYDKRKASDNDNALEFLKNDIKDRANDATKKFKSKASKKIQETMDRALNDERMKEDVEAYRKDPNKGIENLIDEKNRKRNVDVAVDAVMPTYEGSKASNEDNLKDFLKNDLKDRTNNMKKKLKQIVKYKLY